MTVEVIDDDLNNDGDELEINNDVETKDNPEPDLENAETSNEESAEEFVIEIEGESTSELSELEKDAPDDQPLHKQLRNVVREKSKQVKDLEVRLSAIEKANQQQQQQQKPPELQRKELPDYWADGIDGDDEKFKAAVKETIAHNLKVDEQEFTIKKQQEEETKEWNSRLENLAVKQKEAEKKFGKEKYDSSAARVSSIFSQAQLGILVDIFEDPATIIAALGQSKKLEELAKEKSPWRLSAKLKDFEKGITMKPRTPSTVPTQSAKGSGGGGGVSNPMLDRLEAEAAKSGDRTKVIQYKRELREKQGK